MFTQSLWNNVLVLGVFVLLSGAASQSFAAPEFSSCISDDNMVKIALAAQSEDQGAMIDVKVGSNNESRPAEVVFPTRENIKETMVSYTLLDSDFELLIVERATGKGKLSRGQFGSPNPYIDVTCKN